MGARRCAVTRLPPAPQHPRHHQQQHANCRAIPATQPAGRAPVLHVLPQQPRVLLVHAHRVLQWLGVAACSRPSPAAGRECLSSGHPWQCKGRFRLTDSQHAHLLWVGERADGRLTMPAVGAAGHPGAGSCQRPTSIDQHGVKVLDVPQAVTALAAQGRRRREAGGQQQPCRPGCSPVAHPLLTTAAQSNPANAAETPSTRHDSAGSGISLTPPPPRAHQ